MHQSRGLSEYRHNALLPVLRLLENTTRRPVEKRGSAICYNAHRAGARDKGTLPHAVGETHSCSKRTLTTTTTTGCRPNTNARSRQTNQRLTSFAALR